MTDRAPLCPHTAIPLGWWCVTCGVWRTVIVCMLAISVLSTSGCATLPDAARMVPESDVERVHDAWVAAGNPTCLPLPVMRVLEATEAERVRWCRADPPPSACLAHPRTSPMRTVWMAVVTEGAPVGPAVAHETMHAIEAQCTGRYTTEYVRDEKGRPRHPGRQWDPDVRRLAGMP